MANPLASALNRFGLYSVAKRVQRYLTNAQYRRNQTELEEDFRKTRDRVAAWADQRFDGIASAGLMGIVSFTNLPMHAKFHSLLAKAMQLRGYEPVIFTQAGCR